MVAIDHNHIGRQSAWPLLSEGTTSLKDFKIWKEGEKTSKV